MYFFFAAFIITACEKNVAPDKQPENLKHAPNAKSFAQKWLSQEIIDQFNWLQQVPLFKHDTLIGVKVLHNNLAGNQLQYIVIQLESNEFTKLMLHQIQYEGVVGKSTPLKITSVNLIKKTTASIAMRLDSTGVSTPKSESV